jgi:phosphohistidine swiveling domain-containing protein
MSRVYESPGPGSWEQDSTHCPRPVTEYMFDLLQEWFPKGFSEGTARFGLLFSHLEPARVNGFVFYKQVGAPDSEVPQRFAAAQKAFESKLWFEDLARWDEEYKPDSIRRNRKLQSVSMRELDTDAFIGHLEEVRANAGEMLYRHHIFTAPSIVPIGHYLASALEWTGLSAGELLSPLRGGSPVSCGATDELRQIAAALDEHGVGPGDYDSGLRSGEILDQLRSRNDSVSAAINQYLDVVGVRVVSGYDVADPCAIEMPHMILSSIWASGDAHASGESSGEKAALVRDAVPDLHRDSFDELLDDVRRMSRLRDERGVYNDNWGTGIARCALLEAGRRLVDSGRIEDAEMAVDASHDETLSMLRGVGGPGVEELRERGEWRRNALLSEVPPLLGDPPAPPPPLDQLPPHARLAMRAMGVALAEVFTPADDPGDASLAGKPVSPGVYEGVARIVLHPKDFDRLGKGDVLVTSSTSAAFNVVLPLIGAVVTDRGGQLSHAAIVAREYGIPGVVGSLKATSVIPDGARVRVDGNTGKVQVL